MKSNPFGGPRARFDRGVMEEQVKLACSGGARRSSLEKKKKKFVIFSERKRRKWRRKCPLKAAAEEVSHLFKTLINSAEVESLKQLQHLMSMKGTLLATYPDAFPDSSTTMVLDQRPDLERPLE